MPADFEARIQRSTSPDVWNGAPNFALAERPSSPLAAQLILIARIMRSAAIAVSGGRETHCCAVAPLDGTMPGILRSAAPAERTRRTRLATSGTCQERKCYLSVCVGFPAAMLEMHASSARAPNVAREESVRCKGRASSSPLALVWDRE